MSKSFSKALEIDALCMACIVLVQSAQFLPAGPDFPPSFRNKECAMVSAGGVPRPHRLLASWWPRDICLFVADMCFRV